MTGTYESEFNAAINRTIENEIENPGFTEINKRYLDDNFLKNFPEVVKDTFGEFKSEELSMKCFDINRKLLPLISSMIGEKAYLTFGYINTSKRSFFKSSESDLIKLIKNQSGIDKPLTLHCWITLPSYEIIDPTFFTSYAVAFDCPNLMFSLTTLHPSELKNGMSYHPQFVGSDFLVKTGILHLRLKNSLICS